MHGAVHPVQSKAALPPERNIYIQKIDNLSKESDDTYNFEMTEFNQAVEELKEQVVENNSAPEFSGEKNKTENDTRQDSKIDQEGISVSSEEYEDECPHLIALSSLNKEFRPFRYRSLLIAFCV